MKSIKFIVMLVFISTASIKAEASAIEAPEVSVRVESYNKTILSTVVNAYTFRGAIDRLAADNGIDVVYSQLGKIAVINSIGGIRNNKFNDGDRWFGYVKRDGLVIQLGDYLSQSLKNGDELVLYYGKEGYTQVVSEVDITENSGAISFYLKSKYSTGGQTFEKPSSNVKIYLTTPDNQRRILITNNLGKAITELKKFGVYSYILQDAVVNSCPNVVKSESGYFFYGLNDQGSITRAEAAAFLVSFFKLSPEGAAFSFSDVNESHLLYNEINAAAANNLILGYEDGTFKPDDKINLLQLSIMVSNTLQDKSLKEVEGLEALPSWAKAPVSNVVYNGLLSGMAVDFEKPVSGGDLIIIYNNLLNVE
ncbi:MAG: S-layer homology domain-containing protein [Clostridiales bacterium]|nr:S-layer homology domain-containing protein [Clostridiales bacterium]